MLLCYIIAHVDFVHISVSSWRENFHPSVSRTSTCWLSLGSPTRILGRTSAPPLTNREKWRPLLHFRFTVSLQRRVRSIVSRVGPCWTMTLFASFSERVMPYFAQEPLSYLTLPTIKNAYKTFSIKINFRPDNVDGKEVQISLPVTLSIVLIYVFMLTFVIMCCDSV